VTRFLRSGSTSLVSALEWISRATSDPAGQHVCALDQEPDAVVRVVELQAASWGGGRPVGELLDAIERAGAITFAAEARGAFAG
jgi:hypothetical protein